MIQGKTSDGFEYSIDERVLDDMRLIYKLKETGKDPTGLCDVVDMVLGEDQRDRLFAFIEKEAGYASAKRICKAIGEILHTQGKNS